MDPYDLAIVGYGPTGMTLAALLGGLGHRVIVLERYHDLYNLPRAACFDDEIMRTFQKLGLVDAVTPGSVVQPDYEWVNAAGATLHEITYDNPAPGGWAALYMMYQPHIEAVLDRFCKGLPTVEVRQGVTVDGLDQQAGGVTLTATDRDGTPIGVQARYVAGADGGAGFVRSALGVEVFDYGFEENWLVCDFRKNPGFDDVPSFRQVCDPAQPVSIVRIGPHHHRFSFMLDPDEKGERATDPERAWARVAAYVTPADAELVRVANYVFRSRVAARWRTGRILLAGDAAHEMPPFLAQGMCSGIRDSHNLAWKLDLVLTGRAGVELLDTYQPEREPHVRFITEKAIALGRVQTLRDPDQARARDERLLAHRRAARAPERLRFPPLSGGLIGAGAGAGEFFVQGHVRAGAREGLFDDLAGPGPSLVALDGALLEGLGAAEWERWERLGGRTVVLDGAQATDLDGVYDAWFAAHDCAAAVVRPDWYVFGTATGPDELSALLSGLEAGLRVPTTVQR